MFYVIKVFIHFYKCSCKFKMYSHVFNKHLCIMKMGLRILIIDRVLFKYKRKQNIEDTRTHVAYAHTKCREKKFNDPNSREQKEN